MAEPAYLEFDAVMGDEGQVLDFKWARTSPLAKVMLGCGGADTPPPTLYTLAGRAGAATPPPTRYTPSGGRATVGGG